MADNDSRQGKRYATRQIIEYVDRTHARHDSSLAQAFDTPDGEDMPAIQVGPSEGKLLELLVTLTRARRVVEVGTLAGYSAIRMARALPEDGHLWTLDVNADYAARARENIRAAGLDERIDVIVASGLDGLEGIAAHGPFDLVFLDADKAGYREYGRWARDNLRSGGVLVADNVYYFGRLLDEDGDALAVRTFHEETAENFESVCVPTPDGMLLAIKP